MILKNQNNSEKLALNHDAWKLQGDDRTEVILLQIRPGESLRVHRNTVPVIFYIVEGTGLLTVDGHICTAAAGDLVEVSPGQERGWENAGESELKLLVIKKL